MPVGELAGLAGALVWATTNTVLRGQSARLGAFTTNAWRALFASACFLVIFLLTRRVGDLFAIELRTLVALLASVVIGMAIGDALQFNAMTLIGVSRAMPISGVFPLLTVVLATLFLDEPVTVRTVAGALLVIVGVTLVALPRRAREAPGEEGRRDLAGSRAERRRHWLGVGLALAAAACWACSTTITRVAIEEIDVITANTIRLPFSALVSLLFGLGRAKLPPSKFGLRSFAVLFVAGALGTTGGGYLYLTSVKLAGAAKTAILASTAPVFAMPLAMLFLRERPGPRAIVGTLLAIAGIALVV